jgi:hypothetical protein
LNENCTAHWPIRLSERKSHTSCLSSVELSSTTTIESYDSKSKLCRRLIRNISESINILFWTISHLLLTWLWKLSTIS